MWLTENEWKRQSTCSPSEKSEAIRFSPLPPERKRKRKGVHTPVWQSRQVQRVHTGKPTFQADMVPSHTGRPREAEAQAITEHAALIGTSKSKSGCCTEGARPISGSAGSQRLSAVS
eukprot:GHVU01012209.1.p1 GENE.GHVU01012209.1~~GHVU01012209.1.p1  ORF type:complete len:117 (+),score=7.87 GHVU01012209.1:599-949(+)